MPDPLDNRRTPVISTGGVPPGAFSPTELTDLLAVSSGAEIRAAFACGMASALLPVVVIAAQEPELARMDRMAYLAAAGLLSLALLAGLATFLDAMAVRVADLIQGVAGALSRPVRGAVAHAARVALRRMEGAGPASRPARAGVRVRLLERLADSSDSSAPASLRVRRALAKSVAAQSAATLAVFGAFIACIAWTAR